VTPRDPAAIGGNADPVVVDVGRDTVPLVAVRVLGPVQVDVHGARVELGGPRPRALLALLALEAGATVTLGRLIETLWDGEEPDGAKNAVQVYVSRLRKSLGAAGPTLTAMAGGYLLDIAPDDVDVARFERFVGRGQTLAAAGDHAGAADLLTRGLALWRGEALGDLGPAGDGLRATLDARRLAARTCLVECELARGRHAVVLPELEGLAHLYPLDEHLAALHMTALYRSGRQSDALAVHAAAVTRLDDELGVDPGAELRSVHQQVLRHELPEPPPEAAVVEAAVVEAAAAEAASADPPSPVAAVTTSRSPGGRVPAKARLPLVGRDGDVRVVLERLADPQVRAVTLVGLGGVGKTRLATEVSHLWRTEQREVLLVALAGTESPAAALPEIGRVAGGVPTWAGEPALDIAERALDRPGLLLVLDNLEQLIDRPGDDELLDHLDELLDRLPGLRLLATSRTPLELAGEFLVPLGPLPVPPVEVVDPHAVLGYPAVQLFVDRARACLPTFEVSDENAEDVAAVCRMLDGLPLALELAAARVRFLPPSVMVRRGEGTLGLLDGGPRSLPQRHRSIRAALDWSVSLLDADESRVFARLSVFAGGWTPEAAEAVCAAAGLDTVTALGVVGRLVDRSLVAADGSGRAWLLELVREYASERLAAMPGDAERAARTAHRDYYLDLAERLGAQFRLGLDPAVGALLGAEAANFAMVLGRLQAEADAERLARLVVVLLDHWFYSGALVDADRWLAVADSDDLPPLPRAHLHQSAGNLALVSGDLRRAGAAFEAARAVAVELDDALLLARLTTMVAVIARYRGDLLPALGHLEVARSHALNADSPQAVAVIDNERGEVLANLGRTDEGRPLVEAMQRFAESENSPGHLATSSAHLALMAHADGDPTQAVELIGRALSLAEQSGETPVLGDVLVIAGLLELALGEPAAAVGVLRRAVRVHHHVALLLPLPDIASLLGAALVATGDPEAGARLLAAGATWRTARGLAIGYPLTARIIEAAEAEVAEQLAPGAWRTAQAVGASAPFAQLDALEDLSGAGPANVVDIRQATARRSARGQKA
jgi:predicted ATPase/DNA-binding SARP family transcriptional activator